MDILVYKDGRFVCTENPLKAGSLEGLAMLVTNPQDGDVLKYDAASGTWLNGAGSDFAPTITSPQNGQVIKYNGTAWVNGTGGGDFAPDISNPEDGDTLVYNASQQKWVNGAASGGMVVPVFTTSDNYETFTCDKTFAEVVALVTSNKCVMAMVDDGSGVNPCVQLYQVEEENGSISLVKFMSFEVTGSHVVAFGINYTASEITFNESTYSGGIDPNPD